MGKNKIEYRMLPALKPTAILCYLFILVQIRGRSYVSGESLYNPNLSISPDVLHFLHTRQGQVNNFNMPNGREGSIARDLGESNGNNDGESRDAAIGDAIGSYRKLYTQGVSSDFIHPEFNGKKSMSSRYGNNEGDTGVQNQQDSGYGEQQQQLQQLPPTGFLFSKPFSQFSNSKIFNQPNGLLMDKEASVESETNGRLGLLTGFNEFNLPSKQVVIRSRPFRLQVAVPSSTSKRNSAGGRDGYMCHFKLCQLGASGKRRWSPLFEND